MKNFKIVVQPIIAPIDPIAFEVDCELVNEQAKKGWSVVNTFQQPNSSIVFVLEKKIESDYD